LETKKYRQDSRGKDHGPFELNDLAGDVPEAGFQEAYGFGSFRLKFLNIG
jgi:hypothetical protein